MHRLRAVVLAPTRELAQQIAREAEWLFGGTVLTVAMYYVHIPSVALTIFVALLIASVKAGFVAAVFMHLSDEKKTIYNVLICTVFFLIGLMALTIWAMHDQPFQTLIGGKPA